MCYIFEALRINVWGLNKLFCIGHDFSDIWWLLKEPFFVWCSRVFVYALGFFSVFLGRRTAWMFGSTPPCAMVTPASSLFNSSSLRTAS